MAGRVSETGDEEEKRNAKGKGTRSVAAEKGLPIEEKKGDCIAIARAGAAQYRALA